MNRISKILLSFLAGVETTFYIISPILITSLWGTVAGYETLGSIILFLMGLVSTTFRAIKIGWMK